MRRGRFLIMTALLLASLAVGIFLAFMAVSSQVNKEVRDNSNQSAATVQQTSPVHFLRLKSSSGQGSVVDRVVDIELGRVCYTNYIDGGIWCDRLTEAELEALQN